MSTRVRIGKTNTAVLRGEMDLSVWTDEELIRGQRRDKNGRWGGRPPKLVPTAIHDELVKRKMSQAYDLLRENIVEASQLLIDVIKDTDTDPHVRLKAAALMLDRVLGKAPERLEVAATEPPWAVALRAAIVPVCSIGPAVIDVEAHDPDDD